MDEGLRGLDDVGVEGAGKALVAGDDDDEDVLLFALDQQRMNDFADRSRSRSVRRTSDSSTLVSICA